MVTPVQRADIQRLEARKAQLIAAQKANQDIKSMLTPRELDEYENEGFDGLVQRIDDLIDYTKTEEHI